MPCGGRESFATAFCVEHATVQAMASVLGLADFSHPHHVCTFVPDHVEMMVVCLCTSGTRRVYPMQTKKKKKLFFSSSHSELLMEHRPLPAWQARLLEMREA